jgi:hypothetical protein
LRVSVKSCRRLIRAAPALDSLLDNTARPLLGFVRY